MTPVAPSPESVEPVYEWKLAIVHDLFRMGSIGSTLFAAALRSTGTGRIALFGFLGLALLAIPLWVGLILGGTTATVYALFQGLASVIGTLPTFLLALLVILASLGGGLFILGRLLLRGMNQAVDRDRIHWARLPRLLSRLRFWGAVMALVPLGPVAYSLVALSELAPASFTGDVQGDRAWERFFIDQVLNGALLGLPQSVVKLSNIQPAVWYANLLMLVYKACLLNGFFWVVFQTFKLASRPPEERFTGTVSQLVEHLRSSLPDLPNLYRLQFPVEVQNPGAAVQIDDGRRDTRDLRIEIACLGVLQTPGEPQVFYSTLNQTLRTALGTQ